MSGFGLQRLPSSIRFGRGAREGIGGAVAALGRRAVVIADPFLATAPAFDRVRADLDARGVRHVVLTDFAPELPVAVVEAVAAEARAARPDVVLGYGGGSALDLAKTVALLLAHGGPLDRYYGENALPGEVLPIVAVPTTAGTGSEVTPVAVVSDPSRLLKVGISDPRLIPRVAIIDPDLSSGAPAAVTANAGADALVHALESLTACVRAPRWDGTLPVFVGRNSFSTLLALEAAESIGPSLPAAVLDGADPVARERMAWGSLLAGMAFGAAGTHLAHALQYPIGALTSTPHGLGTGMLLPYVLQVCRDAVTDELARVGASWGIGEDDPHATAQAVVDRTAEIAATIGLPATLAELGLGRDQLPEVARLASGVTRLVQNSPVPADEALLRRILDAAYTGDRSALQNGRTP